MQQPENVWQPAQILNSDFLMKEINVLIYVHQSLIFTEILILIIVFHTVLLIVQSHMQIQSVELVRLIVVHFSNMIINVFICVPKDIMLIQILTV